ncbi:MAG TPA: acyl carrier protein [Sphingobacterium sp.]|nr:acyl carrier protein [Sphingobacterium sp.]
MEEKIFDAFREAMDNEDLDINPSDKFREYEDWDSLAYLSMIAALDEEFGVEIENEEFEKLETVEDLIERVDSRVGSIR